MGTCSQGAELYSYNAFLAVFYILLSHAFDNSFLHTRSFYTTLTKIKTTVCINRPKKVVFGYNGRFSFLFWNILLWFSTINSLCSRTEWQTINSVSPLFGYSMSNIHYKTTSTKGKPTYIVNDDRFIVEKLSDDKTIWCCERKRYGQCKSRLHTMNNQIIGTIVTHNHEPIANTLQVVHARFQMTIEAK